MLAQAATRPLVRREPCAPPVGSVGVLGIDVPSRSVVGLDPAAATGLDMYYHSLDIAFV